MTEQQLKQAQQMHLAGITWEIISRHFKVAPTTLRKHIKHYETQKQSGA